MRKLNLCILLLIPTIFFAQTTDPGVTSTAAANGNHAFVGTHANGVFSNWLDTGSSATAYNLLGFSNSYAGFGVVNGSNIVSPIIWMYGNENKNAFRVRTMAYNGDMTSGVDLFTVRGTGNVGIGTTTPSSKLTVLGGSISWGDTFSGSTLIQNSSLRETSLNTNMKLVFIADQVNTLDSDKKIIFGAGDTSTDGPNFIEYMRLDNGNLGIGTTNTKGFKLGVQGKIAAEEVKVATYANWSDFVFESDYSLPTLKEVENHIAENGHLKDIPSTEDVKKDGFYLAEMDSKLLQKIEELTLYTINQEKRIENLESKNKKLITLVEQLLEQSSEK